MIDTETKRRSVSGYTNLLIAPVADGTLDAADREHIAWLYAGIAAAPIPADTTTYLSDAYIYDSSGGTGSVLDGTVQGAETIYD